MRQRVREAAAASAQQQQAGERQPSASSATGPSRPATPSTAAAAAASAELNLQQQAAQQEERVTLQLDFAPTEGDGSEQGQEGASVRVHLQLLPPLGSVSTASVGAGSPASLASLLRQLVAAAASTAGESLAGPSTEGVAGPKQPRPDAALLHQAQASLARLAAQQGVTLAAAQNPSPSSSSTPPSSTAKPADSLAAAAAASAAAEAELASLRERCASLEGSSTRLATELAAAQHEVSALQEAAERRAAEARGRAGAQQAHLQELLRVAQVGGAQAVLIVFVQLCVLACFLRATGAAELGP